MKPVVKINFSNGVGNNIFQYVFARLFAEAHGFELSHPPLPVLNIPDRNVPLNHEYGVINLIGSSKIPLDYHALLNGKQERANYILKIYPEDFTLYNSRIDEIRSWFPFKSTKDLGEDDLVFHLRLGDRLIMKSTYEGNNYVSVQQYQEAIETFDFKRLHICTDMAVWTDIGKNDVSLFIFHRGVKKEDRIDNETAAEHFNSLVRGFRKYRPNVRAGALVEDDFNYMRSAKKLLLQHGTLSWWAGALGYASEVAVYERWREGKKINLGWTDFEGWRQWGPLTAPPRSVKEYHLRKLARQFGLINFVETGTAGGSMLLSLADNFKRMHSVEIDPEKVAKAKRKLRQYKWVNLHLGSSTEVLPKILKQLDGMPALFWLDAHAGREATPIIEELKILLPTKSKHILVIDDLRYFGTEPAYPSASEILSLVEQRQPTAKVDFKFDSIRIFT